MTTHRPTEAAPPEPEDDDRDYSPIPALLVWAAVCGLFWWALYMGLRG